ncbi:glycosyltransferase family 2 protein [Mycoplasmatota bacterium]|nr:glycosyltransferase family 2 protein [Mycoplasmatota bacterium]
MKEKITLVVPCYNEEKMIPIFYQEITRYMHEFTNYDYEILLVNDGSKDNTWLELKKLTTSDKHIKAINFSRNFGKEAAMLAGLTESSGDYVVVMDADLQHPPHLLAEMLRLIKEEGFDSVGAYRLGRSKNHKSESFFRVLYSKLFYRFINKMSDVKIKENATDYRMMRRKVVDALLELQEYNRFSKGLFEWVGFKTTYVGYENVNRVVGSSSWSFFKLFNYAIEGITSFSSIPLKFSGILGVFSAFLSFVYMVYIIVDRIVNGTEVSGWATIVSIILFLGGITLISLGLLGEYIGRIYGEVKHRPIYIVDEIVNNKKEMLDEKTN